MVHQALSLQPLSDPPAEVDGSVSLAFDGYTLAKITMAGHWLTLSRSAPRDQTGSRSAQGASRPQRARRVTDGTPRNHIGCRSDSWPLCASPSRSRRTFCNSASAVPPFQGLPLPDFRNVADSLFWS